MKKMIAALGICTLTAVISPAGAFAAEAAKQPVPSGSSQAAVPAKETQTIRISRRFYRKLRTSKDFSLKAVSTGNGKLRYRSSDPKVASVSSKGKVNVKRYGRTVITISCGATSRYREAAPVRVTVDVVPKAIRWKYVRSPEKKKIKASWKYDKTVTGYRIEIYRDKKLTSLAYSKSYRNKRGKNAYTDTAWWKGFLRGRTYYLRMRSYVRYKGHNYYSNYSTVKAVKSR
jgi:hypothetical protein